MIQAQVFLGPMKMGSQHETNGVYSIIHFLIIIARWGMKE